MKKTGKNTMTRDIVLSNMNYVIYVWYRDMHIIKGNVQIGHVTKEAGERLLFVQFVQFMQCVTLGCFVATVLGSKCSEVYVFGVQL